MTADQHPAGKHRPVRIELPVGHLQQYLVGVLGGSGVPVLILEGRPDELRGVFAVGLAAVSRAEDDRKAKR